MNYIQKYNHNTLDDTQSFNHCEKLACKALGFDADLSGSEKSIISNAEGSLTNYKKDVDTLKYSGEYHYGLNAIDMFEIEQKHIKQKMFLSSHYLYDSINKRYIPLQDLIISANHSPDRYYSQIQNRVNTLCKIANERKLSPIFMTITLPSEFHPTKTTKSKKVIPNPKYNNTTPKVANKILTKMFAKLRQDRSLKELSKEDRIYFRVNEPHENGTPHCHILMFIPLERIERVEIAFKRLFDNRANDIELITKNINNSVAYIMKYINKVLPLSKKEDLSTKQKFLNGWYAKNRIIRFHSSKTLAPLSLYKLLHKRFSLYALTKINNKKELSIFTPVDSNQIVMICDGDEMIYEKSINYKMVNTNDIYNEEDFHLENSYAS